MTWTFDYTVTFAIGSLVIIVAGAFIFYLGMLFCDRQETEYGKFGIPRRYDKIKYYKYGALFLDTCATSIITLLFLLIFVLSQILLFLKIDITNIRTDDVFTDSNTIIFFVVILAIDLFSIPLQFFLLSWYLKQIEKYDSEDPEYSNTLHAACIFLLIIPVISLIVVGIVSIFLISIIHSITPSGKDFSLPDLLRNIIFSFIILAFYILLPVILALLNISSSAILYGCFCVRQEMADIKQIDKFFVYLADGKIVDGHKLKYRNGIYTLIKSDTLNNIESEFTIYEDRVHHIKRVYDNKKSGYTDLDRVTKEMKEKFGITSTLKIGFLKKKSVTENIIESVISENPQTDEYRLEITNRAKRELDLDAIRAMIAREFSHCSNGDSPKVILFFSWFIALIISIIFYLIFRIISPIVPTLIYPTWFNYIPITLCIYLLYYIMSISQEIRADIEAFQAVGNIKAVKDYLGGLKKNKKPSIWHRIKYPHPTIQLREDCLDFIEANKLQKPLDIQNKLTM